MRSWLSRHPTLALLAINGAIFLGACLVFELVLRLYIPYNPGFYTEVEGNSREIVYAYGTININSHGFPDDEFELTKTERVGYFGDSVTYGVGAGSGYRISDLLERAYPDYEHLNLAGIGQSISHGEIAYVKKLATRFKLTRVIYLFNLNDILPDVESSGEQTPTAVQLKHQIVDYFDVLRGRSYLYTYLRTAAKNFLQARGVGFQGYTSYELFPRANLPALKETAERINHLAEVLSEQGVKLTVVLLPYEMQISQEAEETYARLGIDWEPDFIEGETQKVIIGELAEDIHHFDAYYAFVDSGSHQTSRAENGVGEYFVYNKGDKLDWNHPNRAGHAAIATYLVRKQILAPDDGALAKTSVNSNPKP